MERRSSVDGPALAPTVLVPAARERPPGRRMQRRIPVVVALLLLLGVLAAWWLLPYWKSRQLTIVDTIDLVLVSGESQQFGVMIDRGPPASWRSHRIRESGPIQIEAVLLASLVGVGVGLLLSAVSRTSETAISVLPIVLLAMVVLGGAIASINRLAPFMQRVCDAIPTRWAFEDMLLLESERRPVYTYHPALPNISPIELKLARPSLVQIVPRKYLEPQDLAENYFPQTGENPIRRSIATDFEALAVLLVVLVVAIHVVLRLRDVH